MHCACQPHCCLGGCLCISNNVLFIFYSIKSEWSCFSFLVFLILQVLPADDPEGKEQFGQNSLIFKPLCFLQNLETRI